MKTNQKKLWASIGAIGVSAILLISSAFAATTNLSGYTRFKEIILDTNQSSYPQNATTNMDWKLEKDGTTVMTMNTKAQTEENASYSINTLNVGSETMTQETWSETTADTDQYVTKSSKDEKYQVLLYDLSQLSDDELASYNYDYDPDDDESMTDSQSKFVNAVIDTLAGDMKNYFSVSGNTVSVHLDSAQIPELVHLATAVVEEGMRSDYLADTTNPYRSDVESTVLSEMFSMKDYTIESLDASLEVENDQIQNISFSVQLSAVDAQGTKHTLTMSGTGQTTDINNTVAERINLDDIKDQSEIETQNVADYYVMTETYDGLSVTSSVAEQD